MSTLFAFLHHLCAFTLVSALAIEFALIRQELTRASARRLQVTDIVFGGARRSGAQVATVFGRMLFGPLRYKELPGGFVLTYKDVMPGAFTGSRTNSRIDPAAD